MHYKSLQSALKNYAPQINNAVCALQITHSTFFYPGKSLKKLADDQWSSITKGGVYYYIKHNVHTFYHAGGLTRNLTFFNGRISKMFAHTAFLLCGTEQDFLPAGSSKSHQFWPLCSAIFLVSLSFFFGGGAGKF